MIQDRLWSKDFVMISGVNFLLTLVFYLLVVIMGLYSIEVFDATTSEAGLVTGIFIVGTLLGRLYIGGKIERIGKKKTLLIGFGVFLGAIFLYFIELGVGFLMFTRFVHGIGFGLTSTAAATIVTYIIPAHRRGEGIGYFSMSSTLATAIGPLIGVVLTRVTSFTIIFIVCLSIAVVGFILSLSVRVIENSSKDIFQDQKRFAISNYLEIKILPIGIITVLFALSFSSVLSFMNLYAVEKDLLNAASLFFLFYAIAILVSRPFTGRLLDSRGANFVMYPAFMFFSLGLITLGMANSDGIFLLAAVLLGLGFGNLQSCTQAIAVKMVPLEKMGMATSTFYIFFDAGLGFGPYLIGFLLALASYSQMYVGLGVFAIFVCMLYVLVYGRYEKSRLEQLRDIA